MKEKRKREWAYIQKPQEYGIECDICGGTNLQWSEYAKHIWCYDCEKDTKGTMGVFDGPILRQACEMMGMSFDRVTLATGEVQTLDEYLPPKPTERGD